MSKNIMIITKKPIFKSNNKSIKKINQKFPNANINIINNDNENFDLLKKTNIIFGYPTEKQLLNAEELEWLHLPSAGNEKYINKNLYKNKDLLLSNSSGVYGDLVAEHVLAMIFSFICNLQRFSYNKLNKKWERLKKDIQFKNSNIGIIGLGDIGLSIAKKSHFLGANVLAIRKNITKKSKYVDQLFSLNNIDSLLSKSDFVVLALPSTSKTRNLIGENEFKKMKEKSFLVNISRGNIVDQESLINALKNDWIRGAGLDVLISEPLSKNSILWELDNVLITSHTAGLSVDNDDKLFDLFFENLCRFFEDKELLNLVDFNKEY